MRRAFFITGTDTGVGKTEAACAVARSLKASGMKVGVMKPVETGCLSNGGALVAADAMRLIEASGTEAALEAINPYRFSPALSPERASRLFGVTIDIERIKSHFDELSAMHEVMLVEGAGGLAVPVAEGIDMASLALALGAGLLVVAANRLGTLNHTLLTVRYALSRGLQVAGVILNNPCPEADTSQGGNRADLERLCPAPVLFELPFLEKKEAPFLLEEGLIAKLLGRP